MTVEDFVNEPLNSISSITRIDKSNWSKFFAGKMISEKTLNKASKMLGMSPDELLRGINLRRTQKSVVISHN
ncbi:MAG: hypothetical protein NTU99_06295 [Pseudanabaena sp. LacPavin_0818_WC45_MAG_42_6]|nr:hypothetical protein [Pseudanabaena sp. LacPavin_0818_WC45_MAG_42_6]